MMVFGEKFEAFIDELEKLKPAEWAARKARKMGIGGINVPTRKDPSKTWVAGRDDELDAFRHAYINAVGTAWGRLSSDYAQRIVKLIGDYNEKGKPICGAQMDLFNNDVGQSLAPDVIMMSQWIRGKEDPNDKIARIVADAVRDGRLITGFHDPRLPAECSSQAKIQGKYYVWRSVDDEKIRWEHSVRNGRIFAWDEPPAGGHPGADYNCRCRAEPLDVRFEDDLDEVFEK